MIDPHVHTREPGYTHKEDIFTCSQASAAGGVTTMFGMPNLKPSTLTHKDLVDVFERYAEKSLVDYNHNPVPTLGEVDAMAETGIAAYKVYQVIDTGRDYPHPAGTGITDSGHLLQMFEAVAKTGKRFMVHPHNQGVCDRVEQSFWERGDRSVEAYAKTLGTHDGIIWDLATAELIRMAEATNCPLHLVHVQTSRAVEMIRHAKKTGCRRYRGGESLGAVSGQLGYRHGSRSLRAVLLGGRPSSGSDRQRPPGWHYRHGQFRSRSTHT